MMGNIISKVHGNIDVLPQISERYFLEKDLAYNLESSPSARSYYDKIRHIQKRDRPLQKSNLSNDEKRCITDAVGPNFVEYRNKYIGGQFYEISSTVKTKKTCDSFAVTNRGLLGTITSIFTVDNLTYLLLRTNYLSKPHDIISQKVHFLEKNTNPYNLIIDERNLANKAIFMDTNHNLAYSIIPNTCERD